MRRKSFTDWMQGVNDALAPYFLDTTDLSDMNYYDLWSDGYSPGRVARMALKSAGWDGRT